MIVVASKHIWDSSKGRFEPGVIEIDRGKIKQFIFGHLKATKARVIDYADFHIGPSAIDLHVHCRDFDESHKETFETCEMAAAKGGVGALVAMANTKPRMDTLALVKDFDRRVARLQTSFFTFAAVTKQLLGKKMTDWSTLLKHPRVAGLSDDGKPLHDSLLMEKALGACHRAKKLLSLHEEDLSLSNKSLVHESLTSLRAGLEGSPSLSEFSMVARDLAIAKRLGASPHFGHLSSKEAIALLRKARKEGISFSAELTPHHGLLDVTGFECLTLEQKSLFKVCPVIRQDEDRKALLAGLREGLLDCLATDHAPHSSLEKEGPYEDCMHGIVSLENYYPLYLEVRERARLSWRGFFEAAVFRPATLLRSVMKERPWTVGASANMVVFDPNTTGALRFDRSRSANTPLKGFSVKGQVQAHWLKGKKVYEA